MRILAIFLVHFYGRTAAEENFRLIHYVTSRNGGMHAFRFPATQRGGRSAVIDRGSSPGREANSIAVLSRAERAKKFLVTVPFLAILSALLRTLSQRSAF